MSYAVTEPSIKVVEYAVTNNIPVTPKSNIIYLGALVLGLSLPFLVIYIMFLINRKIYSKSQVEELNLPVPILTEIPDIKSQNNVIINSAKERSPLAESFRLFIQN